MTAVTKAQIDVVSRAEFETHRRSVSKDIENLADAIREEGRQRSRDTETLRQDIKSISITSNRTPYQALGFAFGVFSFVIIVVAAVYGNGLERENKLMDVLAAERISHQGHLIDALTNYDTKQDAAQQRGTELSKNALEEEIKALGILLASKVAGAGSASSARHEAQAQELQELHRRAGLSEEWIKDHDFYVRGINSAQDERLRALERLIYKVTD